MKYIKVKGGIKLVGECCEFNCEICLEKKKREINKEYQRLKKAKGRK